MSRVESDPQPKRRISSFNSLMPTFFSITGGVLLAAGGIEYASNKHEEHNQNHDDSRPIEVYIAQTAVAQHEYDVLIEDPAFPSTPTPIPESLSESYATVIIEREREARLRDAALETAKENERALQRVASGVAALLGGAIMRISNDQHKTPKNR